MPRRILAKDNKEILHQLSLLNENVSSMRRELNQIDERVSVVEYRTRNRDEVAYQHSRSRILNVDVSTGSREAISLMELNTPIHGGMNFKGVY